MARTKRPKQVKPDPTGMGIARILRADLNASPRTKVHAYLWARAEILKEGRLVWDADEDIRDVLYLTDQQLNEAMETLEMEGCLKPVTRENKNRKTVSGFYVYSSPTAHTQSHLPAPSPSVPVPLSQSQSRDRLDSHSVPTGSPVAVEGVVSDGARAASYKPPSEVESPAVTVERARKLAGQEP
jgi:hypothetical protein